MDDWIFNQFSSLQNYHIKQNGKSMPEISNRTMTMFFMMFSITVFSSVSNLILDLTAIEDDKKNDEILKSQNQYIINQKIKDFEYDRTILGILINNNEVLKNFDNLTKILNQTRQ